MFCAGAYSYIPVGGLDAPPLLAEPVEDKPFFAGEAGGAIFILVEDVYSWLRERSEPES